MVFPASWLLTLECSPSAIQSSDNLSFVMQWLSFIFLSPCSQRILFSAIDFLFLLILILSAIKALFSRNSSSVYKPLLETSSSQYKITFWFISCMLLASLLALTYTVLAALSFRQGINSSWDLVLVIFQLFQATTLVSILLIVGHEKKFKASTHHISLRVYWVMSFVLVMLFSGSAIFRFIIHQENLYCSIRIDDIISLISLPVSVLFLIVAIKKPNLVTRCLTQPGQILIEPNVSAYAKASWFSKLLFLWMNPLITKGYKSTLKIEDIPFLAHDHRAETTAELFKKNWPKPSENSNNPLRATLIRCFWKDLLFTAFLAVLRLSVMYIGPALIQSFVNFTSGKWSDPCEGYYLILVLLLAKCVEVLSSCHFNFLTSKLGMLVRSSVVSSLYSKGLRLSSSAKQAHGIGQIVNYMEIDAGQLADMVTGIHSLWTMPLQIVIAILLLYTYVGISSFSAFIIVIAVLLFVFIISQFNSCNLNMTIKRDSRMKVMNEMLKKMHVIKFQAWEEHFNKKILLFRDSEYKWLRKLLYLFSVALVVLWSSPVVLAAVTFSMTILLRVPLDASKVFTVTAVFRILIEPIWVYPQLLVSSFQSLISLRRLNKFLTIAEFEIGSVKREVGYSGDDGIVVEIKGGYFSWDGEDNGGEKGFKVVNLEIKKSDFVAIVGTVGSGKSSLLASILGEIKKTSGTVRVCGTTAYVGQTAWLQNGTIQDNILFGEEMNRERYNEVTRVCFLEMDLNIMEHGHETDIEDHSINLSSGQKQRIQLARAVYQDADIYLLDDIFSAVDLQTGSEIFKECVRGALKDKTVLLVTHQVDFLRNADLILVMQDGKIVQSGKYVELLESGLDFHAYVTAHKTPKDLKKISTTTDSYTAAQKPQTSTLIEKLNTENRSSFRSLLSANGNDKLIDDEGIKSSHAGPAVYKHYLTEAFGWWGVFGILLLSILWQGMFMGSDYWLQYQRSGERPYNPSQSIAVYSIIAGVSCLLLGVRAVFGTYYGLKTAQSFFLRILHSIIHAPVSFFDTTPAGRMLTHASTDQFNVDLTIPLYLSLTVLLYFTLASILFIMCQSAWPTLILIIPLLWSSIWYRGYFIATSRELNCLDSITSASVIQHFSESITGAMTIRCFKKQNSFLEKSNRRLNVNLRLAFHNIGVKEWLGFRLELLGCFVLCAFTMFMIMLPNSVIKPENTGLALSYGLSLNTVLFWMIYMSCVVENYILSVERIKQFIKIPSEGQWKNLEYLPPSNWPTSGEIEIWNLQVRYWSNTPLVLKGISLNIRGGEKIGVVGKDGSGKSTLIKVFCRLVEPCGGAIIIDGLDICKLGLHDLRSRFGIVPQDPVLFQGTVRSNLDPFGLYSDEDIWKSLERCQLKGFVASKPGKLDSLVVDSGENWSMGQRQLLCLARALLKQCRILFMDEATASVDSRTDAVIQKMMKVDFSPCTIITITHRIPTVMDCDRVLVIDGGWAKEFEEPTSLLERPSMFRALVKDYSNRSWSGL